MAVFEGMCPAAFVEAQKTTIRDARLVLSTRSGRPLRFLAKHGDAELIVALEESVPPLDVEKVGIFRGALGKHTKQAWRLIRFQPSVRLRRTRQKLQKRGWAIRLRKAVAQRLAELVEKANVEQTEHKMNDDMAAMKAYAQRTADWASRQDRSAFPVKEFSKRVERYLF